MAAQVKPESDGAGSMAARCPYSRAFTPAFAENPECRAYQGTTFAVLDTAHQPLRAALTCRHLTVGADTRHPGRFYPRCGLGGPEDRLRWVATVTPARLAVMRSLEEEFDEATIAGRTLLVEAKARALAPTAGAADVEALEVELSAFLDRVDTFIDERSDRLADVGLRASQLKELLSDWSMAWLRGHLVFAPDVTDRRLRGVSPAAAAFLGAELPVGEAPAASSSEVVARAGPLLIERTEQPCTIRLRGEIDVSNSDAIATAVTAALGDSGDVRVDFADVLFCDLSGLRALVRAARSVAPAQRITVTALPEHLLRALRLVGWSELPGLVIDGADDDAPGRA
jgi:anti-anti-sigma factor